MGQMVSNIYSKLFASKKARVVMLGLDCAGKTSLMIRLKLGQHEIGPINTVPTIGFNVEQVKLGGVRFELFDIGGGDKIREIWYHYYRDASAVVFILDSTDQNRLPDIAALIKKNLQYPEMKTMTVMILCNKQDLPEALPKETIEERAQLRTAMGELNKYAIFQVSALTGAGLTDAFQWLAKSI